MVGAKGHLVPIDGLPSRPEDAPGVVDEYIELIVLVAIASAEVSDRIQVGEIEQSNIHDRAGVGCDRADGSVTTLGVS